jgi:hypothetical protein
MTSKRFWDITISPPEKTPAQLLLDSFVREGHITHYVEKSDGTVELHVPGRIEQVEIKGTWKV